MGNIVFPSAFEARMSHDLGSEWEQFTLAHSRTAPVSIRINPAKNPVRTFEPVPWSDFGEYLPERPVFTLDPLFHAGAYYVQEASSMFLEQVIKQRVDLSASLRVLDLSAAPGGKSTHLLSLLSKDSLLVSNEVIRSRASVLSENIQKWGYPNCIVTNNDPEAFSRLESFFDVIVVDAPCSGEGLFRKDPAAMHEWSIEHVSVCAARQRRILHHAWSALKEGGILVYSTCTYNESENENNLLDASRTWDCEFLDIDVDPGWRISRIQKENVIGYRLYPHKVRGEGFFISAMKKNDGDRAKEVKRVRTSLIPLEKRSHDTLASWIVNPDHYAFFTHHDRIFLINANHVSAVELLLSHLKVVYVGTNVAVSKHNKLVPDHALALSVVLNRERFNQIDVNEAQALQYLRKESVIIPDAAKGFALIVFRGVPLGWVNILDNRSNNLYPADWRIRMSVK